MRLHHWHESEGKDDRFLLVDVYAGEDDGIEIDAIREVSLDAKGNPMKEPCGIFISRELKGDEFKALEVQLDRKVLEDAYAEACWEQRECYREMGGRRYSGADWYGI